MTVVAGDTFYDAPNMHTETDRLLDDIDTNNDGHIDAGEFRAYHERTLSQRVREISNRIPNSVAGHGTNVILGGALIVSSSYLPEGIISSETRATMATAGYTMVTAGTAGLFASGLKWVTGRGQQQPEPQLPPPNVARRV